MKSKLSKNKFWIIGYSKFKIIIKFNIDIDIRAMKA